MPSFSFKIIILSLLTLFHLSSYTINKEEIVYEDRVYSSNIKSVRMHLEGWEVSYPVMELNGEVGLEFSFDLLDSDSENFYYTVIHCNADWTPSRLMFFEYADGFEENNIRNYEPSFNTIIPYVHYNIFLPNEDLSLNKSGNYLLVVYYKDGNEKNIVITKRFMIYEQLMDISGRVNASADNLHRRTSQKVDFRISRSNLYIDDPFRDIKVVIMQNYQWHNRIENLQPSFMNNHELVYEHEEKNLFRASNEYRYFTFHDTRTLSERVEHIDFRHPYFYVRLFADESNLFRRYSSSEDINGKYVIRTRRFGAQDHPEIESDYALVDFRLNYDTPVDNANVYIFGELSNWDISDEFRMKYNLETRSYEKLLLLKQGYYNYRYVLVHDDKNQPVDHTFFEGSHFETENDYLIFIYHRERGRTYDKLVAYKKLNSRN